MKITLDPGAQVPERAHTYDGGADLFAQECGMIPPFGGSRDGVPLAGGPKSTMPDAKQKKVCVRAVARSTWKVSSFGRVNNGYVYY